VALILDTGSTHAPKQLPLWVKELATKSDGKLTMQLYWLPPNASWLDQIEMRVQPAPTQTPATQAFYQPERA
jgi:hypothetical protein